MTEGRVLGQDAPASATDPLAQICAEIARAIRRAWGRGPVNTFAHWAGPNTIVVLLEDGHTDLERSLRAAGHDEQLMEGRALLHQTLERELGAIVENASRRKVTTILAATRLDPDLSAEIFLLRPMPPAGDEPSTTSRAAAATARSQQLVDEAKALHAQAQRAKLKNKDWRSRQE